MSFTSAYIYKRKQKPKVGTEFNDFQKIFFGVPTGSILGTILFFIFIVDIFFINKSYLFISPCETKSLQTQNSCIRASFSEELRGIKIGSSLTFH